MSVNDETIHPYPGLRPFKYSDSRFFYGRKKIIQDIASELVEKKAIYVVGPSGTGKSSLAYAGLIPALQSGIVESNARRWRTVVFRPSGGPTANLAGAIYDSYHLENTEDKSGINSGNPMISSANKTIDRDSFITLALAENPRSFFKEVRNFARADELTNENGQLEENLLIIADQFEELFRLSGLDNDSDYSKNNMTRLKSHRKELDHFVEIFLGIRAYGGKRIHTLVTMRDEFIADCQINANLHKDVDRHMFLVRKLEDKELSEIITQPARQLLGRTTKEGHPTVHQDLIDRLIKELHQEAESYLSSGRYRLPDQLPLLQHALSQIWLNRHLDGDENDMSLDDYVNICSQDKTAKQGEDLDSGLSLALSTHLNDIYNNIDAGIKNAVKRIFLSLVEFGPQDKWAVRRRVKLSRLLAETGISKNEFYNIAQAFQTNSGHFIYVPKQKSKSDKSFDPIVDISHESLLRHWNKLRGWIDEESRDITTASDYFRRNLLTGPEVEQAIKWKKRKVAEGTFSEAWVSRHLTNIAKSDQSATPETVRQNITDTIGKSVERQNFREKMREEQKRLKIEAEKKNIEEEKNQAIARQKKRTKSALLLACLGILFSGLTAFGIRFVESNKNEEDNAQRIQALLLTVAEKTGTGNNDSSILVAMEAFQTKYHGVGRDKLENYLYTNFVETGYFKKRRQFLERKGLYVADISKGFPHPDKILIGPNKDYLVLINKTRDTNKEGNPIFLINVFKIEIPKMDIKFYKSLEFDQDVRLVDAVQTSEDETILAIRQEEIIEDTKLQFFKLSAFGDEEEVKNQIPGQKTPQNIFLSDSGLYFSGIAGQINKIENGRSVEEAEKRNITFGGFSYPDILERDLDQSYEVKLFGNNRIKKYYDLDYLEVLGSENNYLVLKTIDSLEDLYSVEILDANGNVVWGPAEINEPIDDFVVSEDLNSFGYVNGLGILKTNGGSGQWSVFEYPYIANQEEEIPSNQENEASHRDDFLSKSYRNFENDDPDRNIFNKVEFTGIGANFVAKQENQELFFSRIQNTLIHENVKDFVAFPDKENPHILILTESEIWLYGDKNRMTLDSSDNQYSDSFLEAEKYLKRCLSRDERTRLRLNADVPCFCEDKYPYNNDRVGDNWESDDKKRCAK